MCVCVSVYYVCEAEIKHTDRLSECGNKRRAKETDEREAAKSKEINRRRPAIRFNSFLRQT